MRLLATLLGGMALAQAPAVSAQESDAASYTALQAKDARLLAVGWRLVTGNAPFCDGAEPRIGLLLHDAATYGEPVAARAAFGLSGDIGALSVAPGSPAALAGMAQDATLTGFDDVPVATRFPPSDPNWQRLGTVYSALEDSLEADGTVQLAWTNRDGTPGLSDITGVPACPSRFEVRVGENGAKAEGLRVMVGENFVGFGYPEDEFAAAVAHELAHNVLRHRELLDREGRGRSLVRLTEREADRLIPWLLANAGYGAEAALRFMENWGPRHGGGLLRARTHDGWDERRDFIAAEIALIEQVIADEGTADWSRHFVRDVPAELLAKGD